MQAPGFMCPFSGFMDTEVHPVADLSESPPFMAGPQVSHREPPVEIRVASSVQRPGSAGSRRSVRSSGSAMCVLLQGAAVTPAFRFN